MAADMRYIGTPQVVEATFVAQAVDAGIIETIKSLVTLATDEITLLTRIKEALAGPNKPLAEALNLDTLRAILRYMDKVDSGIGYADQIPDLLNADGPAAIWPVYYAGTAPDPDHVEIGTPTEESTKRAEYVGFHALVNEGLYASGKLPADTKENLSFPVALLPGREYTVRVCYVDAEGNTTRLSPSAKFTAG